MPLADVRRVVSGFLKRFSNRYLFVLQHHRPSVDVVGHTMLRRVLAGHQRSPCWRADRTGGVALCELHTVGDQTIDVWRFVVVRSVTAEIGPAEIVHHQKNDVGPRGCLSPEQGHARGGQNQERLNCLHALSLPLRNRCRFDDYFALRQWTAPRRGKKLHRTQNAMRYGHLSDSESLISAA